PARISSTSARHALTSRRYRPSNSDFQDIPAEQRIMAAYGLYTHIASNKFRSVLLLAGLFVLIYVMVYAGALIAEVVIDSDRSVDDYLAAAAARDLVTAFPYATGAAALWIVIAYFFHQSIVDAVTGGEDVTRQQQPPLYNLLENLCISRGIP